MWLNCQVEAPVLTLMLSVTDRQTDRQNGLVWHCLVKIGVKMMIMLTMLTAVNESSLFGKAVLTSAVNALYLLASQQCISPGSGERMSSEYRTSVFYHNNSPRWNETIRVSMSVV